MINTMTPTTELVIAVRTQDAHHLGAFVELLDIYVKYQDEPIFDNLLLLAVDKIPVTGQRYFIRDEDGIWEDMDVFHRIIDMKSTISQWPASRDKFLERISDINYTILSLSMDPGDTTFSDKEFLERLEIGQAYSEMLVEISAAITNANNLLEGR